MLVPSSAAFFNEWLVSCHTMLIILQSSVYLASSSVPLRTYVFDLNKQLRLATSVAPHSISSVALSTFHIVP